MNQLPAVPSTKPCVSDRCCVWQVATLVFALVVAEAEEITGSGAVVDVWTRGDAVEVYTGDDGLDGVGLVAEEHPASNDAVSTISAVPVGIEVFISPTYSSTWGTHQPDSTRLSWETGIFRYRRVLSWVLPYRCLSVSRGALDRLS